MKTRSMVLTGPQEMVMREFDIPPIGPEEGLLAVEMVGICGSDVGIYKGKKTDVPPPYPLIMGHEIVGRFEEIGERASRRHGIKKGERAIVLCNFGCGTCLPCLLGKFNHCESSFRYGLTISCKDSPHLWGAYGKHLYISPRALVQKIGDDVPPEVGVLIAAVIANGIRWVRTMGGATIGDTVVIEGPGPQGLAGVIAAKESGASQIIIIGLSRDQKRFDLAKEFGATDIVNAEEKNPIEAVREMTQGKMANVLMDTTGHPAGGRLILDLVGKGGTVVIPGGYGFTTEIPLVLDKIYAKEITIQGVRGQDITSVKAGVNLAKAKKYPLEKMVTHRYPLEEAETAIQLVGGEVGGEDVIKAVLVP